MSEKELIEAIRNERLWAMGSPAREIAIMHEQNARELENRLRMLRMGRTVESELFNNKKINVR